ncbi:glycosyltransferase family 4 protein [soil metagenome]
MGADVATRPVGAAIVHDYFIQDGGAEAVALELARLLPDATVYTSFFDADRFGDRLDPARVRTWPFQRVLGPTQRFRSFLPLYPAWFSRLDLSRHDLVVSSSSSFAKAVRARRDALHVSYIHTPMRYAWDLEGYLAGSSFSLGPRVAARIVRPTLQRWDRRTAARPDVLVANSQTVQQRIERLWGRRSELIHPPVDTASIPIGTSDDGFLLVAARLLAYRRIDLAVEACTRLGRQLVVVGEGPERARLEGLAGPTVSFRGFVDRPTLVDLFGRCHAYLLPGVEDFGIAPVEAMAAGKPVVAFREGGGGETVIDGRTGVLFQEQTVGALAAAIDRLDGLTFAAPDLRAHAQTFDSTVFRERWRSLFARLGVDPSLYKAR